MSVLLCPFVAKRGGRTYQVPWTCGFLATYWAPTLLEGRHNDRTESYSRGVTSFVSYETGGSRFYPSLDERAPLVSQAIVRHNQIIGVRAGRTKRMITARASKSRTNHLIIWIYTQSSQLPRRAWSPAFSCGAFYLRITLRITTSHHPQTASLRSLSSGDPFQS